MTNPLITKIREDATSSMKSGNKKRSEVLRYLLSLLQNEEIKLGDKFDKTTALAVLQKEMKRKEESLAMFKKAARDDLIKDQKEEIVILSEYLPEMMSEDEIEKIARQIAQKENVNDFGALMGKLMAQLKGQADGKKVAEVAKRVLE